MATATKERKQRKPKVEKPLPLLIARAQFKSTGSIVYAIRGEEQMYHVTMVRGKATGCCHADDGETCTGFSYRRTCNHVKVALTAESKRQEELAVAASVAPLVVGEQFAADLAEHVADEVANEPAVVLMDADGENALVLRYGQEFVMRVEELAEIGEYEEVFSLLDFEQIKADQLLATTFEQEAFAILDHERREQASLGPQERRFETVNDRPVLMR